jgi:hypothetical protein
VIELSPFSKTRPRSLHSRDIRGFFSFFNSVTLSTYGTYHINIRVFCRDKLLNHIERKHPGLEVPDYLLQKRESQLAAKKLAKSPDTLVTGSQY